MFADIGALSAASTAALVSGNEANVRTVRANWVLDKTSTLTPDGITVAAAAGGGNWIRLLDESDPTWLVVPTWYIDPTNGNDEFTGQAATAGPANAGPLKTHAELERRWGNGTGSLVGTTFTGALNGETVITVNILGTMPITDPINIRVKFKGRLVLRYIGTPTLLYSGTLSAVVVTNEDANQATQFTDPAVTWTTYLGKRIRNTTAGANLNAISWVAKDLGANQARVTEPSTPINMDLAQSLRFQIIGTGNTLKVPAVGNTYVIEDLPVVYLGIVTPQLECGEGSGNTRVNFGELDCRSAFAAQGIQLNSIDQSVAFYSSILGFFYLISAVYFQNCWFTSGCRVYTNSSVTAIFAGGCGPANVNGITSVGGNINFGQRFLMQGAPYQGNGNYLVNVGIFDVPNAQGAVIVGGFQGGVIPGFISCSPGNAQVGPTKLWGSGNVGAGVFVRPGSVLSIVNGVTPTITGAGGDFRLNNKTVASPWDQTANAGAGGYLAPRACTWANYVASVATTGLGRFANDVESGARIVNVAA